MLALGLTILGGIVRHVLVGFHEGQGRMVRQLAKVHTQVKHQANPSSANGSTSCANARSISSVRKKAVLVSPKMHSYSDWNHRCGKVFRSCCKNFGLMR